MPFGESPGLLDKRRVNACRGVQGPDDHPPLDTIHLHLDRSTLLQPQLMKLPGGQGNTKALTDP